MRYPRSSKIPKLKFNTGDDRADIAIEFYNENGWPSVATCSDAILFATELHRLDFFREEDEICLIVENDRMADAVEDLDMSCDRFDYIQFDARDHDDLNTIVDFINLIHAED